MFGNGAVILSIGLRKPTSLVARQSLPIPKTSNVCLKAALIFALTRIVVAIGLLRVSPMRRAVPQATSDFGVFQPAAFDTISCEYSAQHLSDALAQRRHKI